MPAEMRNSKDFDQIKNTDGFGFENIQQAYYTMEKLLCGLYIYVAVFCLVILASISVQFKKAYPELYQSIRCKYYTFFFFYEAFIVYRIYTYI